MNADCSWIVACGCGARPPAYWGVLGGWTTLWLCGLCHAPQRHSLVVLQLGLREDGYHTVALVGANLSDLAQWGPAR